MCILGSVATAMRNASGSAPNPELNRRAAGVYVALDPAVVQIWSAGVLAGQCRYLRVEARRLWRRMRGRRPRAPVVPTSGERPGARVLRPEKNLSHTPRCPPYILPSLRRRAFGQCSNQSASAVIERDAAQTTGTARSPRSAITLGAHRGSSPNTTTRTPSAEAAYSPRHKAPEKQRRILFATRTPRPRPPLYRRRNFFRLQKPTRRTHVQKGLLWRLKAAAPTSSPATQGRGGRAQPSAAGGFPKSRPPRARRQRSRPQTAGISTIANGNSPAIIVMIAAKPITTTPRKPASASPNGRKVSPRSGCGVGLIGERQLRHRHARAHHCEARLQRSRSRLARAANSRSVSKMSESRPLRLRNKSCNRSRRVVCARGALRRRRWRG